MFSQVLDKIDSWLGRSFLVARFFPWLLFAGANLGLACLEFPAVRAFVQKEYKPIGTAEGAVDLVLALAAVAVVAYTISPAMQWITRILEGNGLWRIVAEPLSLGRRLQRDELAAKAAEIFHARASLPKKKDPLVARLRQTLAIGSAHGTVTDTASIKAAERELGKLQRLRLLNRPISSTDLELAIETFRHALLRNCADRIALKPPINRTSYEYATRLHAAFRQFTDVIIPYAIDIAEIRESHSDDANQRLFAISELAPTRLGNDVAALRSYCDTRYGFDFDFFWPRLQLAIADEKLTARLTTAKIQVEFSILSLTLNVMLVVIWLVVLGFWGTRLPTLLVIAVVGPLLITTWLWMVHESYSAYAELVRGVVDLTRFDLLKALRRSLPESTSAENAVWEKTIRLLKLNEHEADVLFKHPSP